MPWRMGPVNRDMVVDRVPLRHPPSRPRGGDPGHVHQWRTDDWDE